MLSYFDVLSYSKTLSKDTYMVKRNKIILGISVVAVIFCGVVLLSLVLNQEEVKPQNTVEQQNTASTETEPVTDKDSLGAKEEVATLNYSDDGYSPETLQVKKGQKVKFTTTSEVPNWVASNPHPAHTDYPEFDTGQILGTLPAPGDEVEFTFEKVGSWGFHNHNQPTHTGTIVVAE